MRKTRERDGQIKIERVPSFFCVCAATALFVFFWGEWGRMGVEWRTLLVSPPVLFFFLKQSKGEKEKT
jgi:hypothetical protein